MECKTSFLLGGIEEELYVRARWIAILDKEHLVCKLKRNHYWLNQVCRPWYKKYETSMLPHGLKRCHADDYLYTKGCRCQPQHFGAICR